jgi:hypothetical protein
MSPRACCIGTELRKNLLYCSKRLIFSAMRLRVTRSLSKASAYARPIYWETLVSGLPPRAIKQSSLLTSSKILQLLQTKFAAPGLALMHKLTKAEYSLTLRANEVIEFMTFSVFPPSLRALLTLSLSARARNALKDVAPEVNRVALLPSSLTH